MIRSLPLTICALGAVGLAQGLPDARVFHDQLWNTIDSYPADGTHAYYWPKKGGWAGVTRDLNYGDSTIATGDPKGRCYCCGLTFEVFFRAWRAWCEVNGRDFEIATLESAGEVRELRRQWFGADGNRRTMQNAIVANGLGRAIEDLDGALPGDFVQLWRHNGSGHSVVFAEWIRRGKGNAISGIRYWSAQKATNGIGLRTEQFGGKRGVDPEQIYIARIGKPTESLRLFEANFSDLQMVEPTIEKIVRSAPDVVGFMGPRMPALRELRARLHGFDVLEHSRDHAILTRQARVRRKGAGTTFVDSRTKRTFTLARRRASTVGLTRFGPMRIRAAEWESFAPTERGTWNLVDVVRKR